MTARRALAALGLLAACQPHTTRPSFTPMPEAAATEIRLRPAEAITSLAEALRADSLVPARVRVRDAYLETAWLDSATGEATRRRPIGTGVVKVRAWADPGRPGNSLLIVETLYRPLADPSLPERELERQVPPEHPTALKVERALEALLKRHGGPPRPAAEPAAAPRQPEQDEAVPEQDEE